MKVPGVLLVSSLSMAFVMAIAAHAVGSATIVGAFAAGLVLANTDRKVSLEERIRPLSDFFVAGDVYSAVVVVVILTTFVAPPLLRASLRGA